MTYKCKYCGSLEVARPRLVNINTQEVVFERNTIDMSKVPCTCLKCERLGVPVIIETNKREDG